MAHTLKIQKEESGVTMPARIIAEEVTPGVFVKIKSNLRLGTTDVVYLSPLTTNPEVREVKSGVYVWNGVVVLSEEMFITPSIEKLQEALDHFKYVISTY